MPDSVIIHKSKEAKKRFSFRELPAQVVPSVTKLSELVFSKGDVQLRYYEPGPVDLQVPHDQEEIYFVVAGSSELKYDGGSVQCEIGDAVFVPKKIEHKFVNSSKNFSVWVIYFHA